MMKMMDCFLKPLVPEDVVVPGRGGAKKIEEIVVPDTTLQHLDELLQTFFYFSLVWSIGATCDHRGRSKFDTWLREKMTANNV